MKKILLSLLVALQSLLWSAEASAAPCVTASLASYVALGDTGCSIGNANFSGFVLRPPQTNAIVSTGITVMPVMIGSTIVGIEFGVAPTSSGGNFYDDLITYRVGSIASNFVGATVDFSGTSTTGDAAVSVAQSICLGGMFLGVDGVSNCSTGNVVVLAVVDIFDSADPPYSLAFGSTGSLAVATDIAYDSGSGFDLPSGSTLTSGTNLFSIVAAPAAVPEPAVPTLLAAGLLCVAVLSRRRPIPPRAMPARA